jgi:tryptophan-rich sensory protein
MIKTNNQNKLNPVFKATCGIITFEIISYCLGLITRNNMDWYNLLNKSILTPKGYVFSIVWTILYAFLAISGYFLYRRKDREEIRKIYYIFILQMLFNWIWTPVFFGLHQLNLALVILVITILLTSYIMIRSFRCYRLVFYMFLPYLCWILFAGYLNFVICIIN